MRTLRLTKNDIDTVVELLLDNQVVALATDTVMGLAITSDSEIAYNELIKVKNRPLNKLFPIMVSDVKMLQEIVNLSERDYYLANKFLPGKTTFIFKLKSDVSIGNLNETVAVRIVADEFIREIVRRLNKPIFLTSANKSNASPSKYANEVLAVFDNEIAAVVMEDADGYAASSIFDLSGSEIKLVREGEVSLCDINKSLKRSCLDE